MEAFWEVGNKIGHFLYVNQELLEGSNKRFGNMLVEIEIFIGLLEEI